MLVMLSDLHLSDGTTSYNPSPQAFEILGKEIEDSAKHNAAQELQIVLLGDIFDVVRTDWWFDKDNVQANQRPWYGIDPITGLNTNPAEVERQFKAVLEKVLAHPSSQAFITMLDGLPACANGNNPKITYVLGNHDRALNNFPDLQDLVREQFSKVGVTFSNSFTDPNYALFARHGHEWDDNCNARLLLQKVLQKKKKWDRMDPQINMVMAIGEVITAELMSGLVYRIGESNNAALASMIKGVDNLRPATDVFKWLDWQARGHGLGKPEKTLLEDMLGEAITGVVDSDLGKLWDKVQTDFLVSGDVVDRLQLVRTALSKFGFDGLGSVAKLFHSSNNPATDQDEYYEGAKEEFENEGDAIQYVLYGHTHCARHDYFAGNVDGRIRMYINTGTYLPLVRGTDDGKGFAKSHQMTLAFFYRDDEDQQGRSGSGPTMDLWNGIKRKEYE